MRTDNSSGGQNPVAVGIYIIAIRTYLVIQFEVQLFDLKGHDLI